MEKRYGVAFISYKWGQDNDNRWVYQFYNDLRTKHGIDAKIDIFDVAPGDSFIEYMTRQLQKCDCMLFIVTPDSVKAVEESRGGIYYELQVALARGIVGETFKIIPIYREGDKTPSYLRHHKYVDFRSDEKYEENLKGLAKWIKGEHKPPPVRNASIPPPIIASKWLLAKAELYHFTSTVIQNRTVGINLSATARETLSNFKYIKIDSGSIKEIGDEVVFLAYFPRLLENHELQIDKVWVRAGKWKGDESKEDTQSIPPGRYNKRIRITRDIYAILSKAPDDLSSE